MNHKRKEPEEQFYLPKTEPELINIPEERDATSDSAKDGTRHAKEHASELQEGNLAESDMAKHAHRLAVNYARSLLLF